jgi:hypothetical protein
LSVILLQLLLKGHIADASKPNELYWFQGIDQNDGSIHTILDTDYENYAIKWTCHEIPNPADPKFIARWDRVHFYGRQRSIDQKHITKMNAVISTTLNFSPDWLVFSDQANCPSK